MFCGIHTANSHAKLHVTSGSMLCEYILCFQKGANNHVAGNEFISDGTNNMQRNEMEKNERMK